MCNLTPTRAGQRSPSGKVISGWAVRCHCQHGPHYATGAPDETGSIWWSWEPSSASVWLRREDAAAVVAGRPELRLVRVVRR